jgi:DNA-binding response OmpR family regulator
MLALVVSCDPELQNAMRSTLRAQGHSMVCAGDIDKARAVVRQASPHVVIAAFGDDLSSLLPELHPSTFVVELPRCPEPDDIVEALERARAHPRP